MIHTNHAVTRETDIITLRKQIKDHRDQIIVIKYFILLSLKLDCKKQNKSLYFEL